MDLRRAGHAGAAWGSSAAFVPAVVVLLALVSGCEGSQVAVPSVGALGSSAASSSSSGPASSSAVRSSAVPSSGVVALSSPSGQSTAGQSPAASRAPARPWMTLPLTDVRTSGTFRIADLTGKIVLLEGVATWCPPCLEQQAQAAAALADLDPSKVVYVSLGIDPREPASTLRSYADRNHFPWIFATGSTEFLRDLAADFGDGVLNPPATPMVVVGADGTAHLTEFGIKSAARIIQLGRGPGG